jgi:hypothetical protein
MIERFVRWYVKNYMPEYVLRLKIQTHEELRAWVKTEWNGYHVSENPPKRKGVNHDNNNDT